RTASRWRAGIRSRGRNGDVALWSHDNRRQKLSYKLHTTVCSLHEVGSRAINFLIIVAAANTSHRVVLERKLQQAGQRASRTRVRLRAPSLRCGRTAAVWPAGAREVFL